MARSYVNKRFDRAFGLRVEQEGHHLKAMNVFNNSQTPVCCNRTQDLDILWISEIKNHKYLKTSQNNRSLDKNSIQKLPLKYYNKIDNSILIHKSVSINVTSSLQILYINCPASMYSLYSYI